MRKILILSLLILTSCAHKLGEDEINILDTNGKTYELRISKALPKFQAKEVTLSSTIAASSTKVYTGINSSNSSDANIDTESNFNDNSSFLETIKQAQQILNDKLNFKQGAPETSQYIIEAKINNWGLSNTSMLNSDFNMSYSYYINIFEAKTEKTDYIGCLVVSDKAYPASEISKNNYALFKEFLTNSIPECIESVNWSIDHEIKFDGKATIN